MRPLISTDGAVYAILFVALIVLFLRFFLLTTGAILHTTPLQWLDASRGTASWGAYLGAVLGVAIATARSGRMWIWLDLGASCAALGEVIGRWGCWLAGDDFGRVTGVAWGIRFPACSPAYQVHAARGLLADGAPASLPVRPLQFYLTLNALVVLVVTTLIWHRWRTRPGLTFGTFLVLHGATRFWWEFLRDPAADRCSGAGGRLRGVILAGAGGDGDGAGRDQQGEHQQASVQRRGMYRVIRASSQGSRADRKRQFGPRNEGSRGRGQSLHPFDRHPTHGGSQRNIEMTRRRGVAG